jgi:hypothetical protein
MVADELDAVRHVTERLFSALSSRDAGAAGACYDQRAVFSSPIIGEVRGATSNRCGMRYLPPRVTTR